MASRSRRGLLNLPESAAPLRPEEGRLAGTTHLRVVGGRDDRRRGRRRSASASGRRLGQHDRGLVLAFAAGAILTMLADTMMPEAFEKGGRAAVSTTLGFAVAVLPLRGVGASEARANRSPCAFLAHRDD